MGAFIPVKKPDMCCTLWQQETVLQGWDDQSVQTNINPGRRFQRSLRGSMGTEKVRHTTLVDALEIPAAVTDIYQMFMERNIVLSHISCTRQDMRKTKRNHIQCKTRTKEQPRIVRGTEAAVAYEKRRRKRERESLLPLYNNNNKLWHLISI